MHQCALKLQNHDIDSRARERPSCPMPFAAGTDKTALAKRRGTSDRALTQKVNVQSSDDPEYAAYVSNATRARFVTGAQGPAAECGLKRGPNRGGSLSTGGSSDDRLHTYMGNLSVGPLSPTSWGSSNRARERAGYEGDSACADRLDYCRVAVRRVPAAIVGG